MENKSSLRRIAWSMVYVILVFGGLRFATGQESQVSRPQQRERIVVRKPWRFEPVRVVAVKNKKNANIEIGRAYDDDDDWLDGFTVRVTNNYTKPVTAISIDMVFRRDPGDSRHPAAWSLNFGPDPLSLEYLRRDPNRVIKVGETTEIQIDPENYKWLKMFLKQNGFPINIRQVELIIRTVGFDDGSVLDSGTLFLQDPNNPNDPSKKIPTGQNISPRKPTIRDAFRAFGSVRQSLQLSCQS
jgi:hypothetical protein